MRFQLNPYRTTLFILISAAYYLFRKIQTSMGTHHSNIFLEEITPIHGIVVVAIFLITLLGIMKLWINSQKDKK